MKCRFCPCRVENSNEIDGYQPDGCFYGDDYLDDYCYEDKDGDCCCDKTKEELKDEIKNRISMALKDPILQQGFEIICKRIAELKKENEDLKEKLNVRSCQNCKHNNKSCPNNGSCVHYSKWEDCKNPQLIKAKEIIEELISSLSVVGECEEEECELLNRAEEFLKENT